MKENIKISVYVGLGFLISFGILFSYLVMYEEKYFDIQLEETQLDTNRVDENNIIFLLGRSYIDHINLGHVQNTLNDNGMNVVVKYENDRSPNKNFKIDDFISKKTDYIVYGIGFNDLGILDSEALEHGITASRNSAECIDVNKNTQFNFDNQT